MFRNFESLKKIEVVAMESADVVGIDEVQFFSNDMIDVIQSLVENGKIVIAAGLDLDFRCWFLTMDRKRLYQRIESRCDEMLENGFLQEVEGLLPLGLEENTTAAQAIGYRQILDYLHGKRSQDD